MRRRDCPVRECVHVGGGEAGGCWERAQSIKVEVDANWASDFFQLVRRKIEKNWGNTWGVKKGLSTALGKTKRCVGKEEEKWYIKE